MYEGIGQDWSLLSPRLIIDFASTVLLCIICDLLSPCPSPAEARTLVVDSIFVSLQRCLASLVPRVAVPAEG